MPQPAREIAREAWFAGQNVILDAYDIKAFANLQDAWGTWAAVWGNDAEAAINTLAGWVSTE